MTTHPIATHARGRVRVLVALVALALALALPSAAAIGEAQLQRLRVSAENATIPLDAILHGGPPPQGIPALGFRGLQGVADPSPEPRFVTQDDASATQVDALRREVRTEPLPEDLARAYERQHAQPAPEYAIDVTFGVSGLLYSSNRLMFDRS